MSKTAHSYFRQHIELHFDDHDIDVVVRKRKRGYAIYWADDEEPLAQLRPTGNEDEVEVLYWDDVRWEPVREFGLSLPLDETLTRAFFEGLRHRFYFPILVMAVITAVVTAVGGVTGWAAHARLGAGFGPLLAGVLVGALCISFLFQGGLGAWLAGLLVGLNLGLYLVAAWNIQDPFGGPLLIALLAAFGASQFCKWFTSFRKLTYDPASSNDGRNTFPNLTPMA